MAARCSIELLTGFSCQRWTAPVNKCLLSHSCSKLEQEKFYWKRCHHVKSEMAWLYLIISFLVGSQAGRYRTCAEGCCVHEYCAYHRICYPRIHCSLGCPDGHCVGQVQTTRDPTMKQITGDSHNPSVSERYSYNDKSLSGSGGERKSEVTGGMCMPFAPCKEGDMCGFGQSCSFNYNLGYHICQYNLQMGSTLCYDRHGNPSYKPML